MKTSSRIFWVVIIAIFAGISVILLSSRHDVIKASKSSEVTYSVAHVTTKKQIKGNGNLVTKVNQLPAFSIIGIDGHYNLTVNPSQNSRVSVTTDENLFAHMKIGVTHDKLDILPVGDVSLQASRPINVVAETKTLRGVLLGGKGSVRVAELNTDKFTATLAGNNDALFKGHIEHLNLNLEGRSTVHVIDLKGGDIMLNINGEGKVYLQGKARELIITTAGAATINAKNLAVENVTITGAGKTEASVNASKQIIISTFGEAIVHYQGHPDITKTAFGKVMLQQI